MRRFPALLLALAACADRRAPPDSPEPPVYGLCEEPRWDDDNEKDAPTGGLVKHVVVLVLDGVRIEESFGLDDDDTSDAASCSDSVDCGDTADDCNDHDSSVPEEETSVFMPQCRERLLPQGTLVRPGYALGIPITGPGHADLVTGARRPFGHFTTPEGGGAYRPDLPTIFESIEEDDDDSWSMIGGNAEHVRSLMASVYPGVGEDDGALHVFVTKGGGTEEGNEDLGGRPEDTDKPVIDVVKEKLAGDEPPRIVVVNLHGIDRAGHFADSSCTYGERIQSVDKPVSEFWTWLNSAESPVAGEVALVITSDHGRHRWGHEEAQIRYGDGADEGKALPDYRNHGDQCRGCREIPMLVMGPGIKRGQVVRTPYGLDDLGRTLAWLLGVPLPQATGALMTELLVDPPDEGEGSREGETWKSVAGGHEVYQRWLPDLDRRSEVVLDGEVVSSPTAIAAEEPRIFATSSGGAMACWRELTLYPDDPEVLDWPWLGQCRWNSGDGWTDVGFPVEMVWPFWAPSFVEDADGSLVMAFVDNPNSTTYLKERQGVRVFRYAADVGWTGVPDEDGSDTGTSDSSAERLPLYFSVAPSITRVGSRFFVATASSDAGTTNTGVNDPKRYSRHIEVYSLDWSDGSQTWSTDEEGEIAPIFRTRSDGCPTDASCDPSWVPTADTAQNTYVRYELPSVGEVEGGLAVASPAWVGDGRVNLVLASADAEGASWTGISPLDDSGRVLGHVQPLWWGGKVHWARLDEGADVEICRAAPGESPDCTPTCIPRISSLSVVGGAVWASLDVGMAQWTPYEITWD